MQQTCCLQRWYRMHRVQTLNWRQWGVQDMMRVACHVLRGTSRLATSSNRLPSLPACTTGAHRIHPKVQAQRFKTEGHVHRVDCTSWRAFVAGQDVDHCTKLGAASAAFQALDECNDVQRRRFEGPYVGQRRLHGQQHKLIGAQLTVAAAESLLCVRLVSTSPFSPVLLHERIHLRAHASLIQGGHARGW
jgi:hypothetical protein